MWFKLPSSCGTVAVKFLRRNVVGTLKLSEIFAKILLCV